MVIGISVDTLADQQKFTDKEHLNFPLVADSDKKAAKAYGALGPRGYANRYTFVIDKQGVVRSLFRTRQVLSRLSANDVLAAVDKELPRTEDR